MPSWTASSKSTPEDRLVPEEGVLRASLPMVARCLLPLSSCEFRHHPNRPIASPRARSPSQRRGGLVAKYMRRHPRPPSWRTFLTNHASQIMAADLFVVPTVTFRLLFVLIILAHDRRRIVHVADTEHPTAIWTAQQLRNAFSENEAPRYLLHDRDSVFADVATTIAGMNMQTVRTAPRSPWQNAYAERHRLDPTRVPGSRDRG